MKKQSCKFLGLVLLGTTILFSSCNFEIEPYDNNPPVVASDSELGIISGTVISPKGKAVANATVEVVGNEKYNTKTNTAGKFSFEAPAGNQELRIFTGSGDVFSSSKTVEVAAETDNSVGSVALSVAPTAKIAYVYGEFDNIQSIITNTLGYQIDSLSHSDMEDIGNLKKYDVVFLNCGYSGQGSSNGYSGQPSTQEQMDNIRKNIGDYVAEGGKIYASDYAVGYIAPSCDVESNYNFDYNYTIISSEEACFELSGESSTTTADVVDKDLASIIGEDADIVYDLGGWAQINSTQNFGGNILVAGESASILAFSQQVGSGQVLYTTFHNEANVSDDMKAILEFFIHNF